MKCTCPMPKFCVGDLYYLGSHWDLQRKFYVSCWGNANFSKIVASGSNPTEDQREWVKPCLKEGGGGHTF